MPQSDLSNYRTVVYILQRKSDEDYEQRFLVLGESSKMAMDTFGFISFWKKRRKNQKAQSLSEKSRKNTKKKSDAFEKKRSGNKQLYVRLNSSMTQPYTRCSTCFLTPLLWVHMTMLPTRLWLCLWFPSCLFGSERYISDVVWGTAPWKQLHILLLHDSFSSLTPWGQKNNCVDPLT